MYILSDFEVPDIPWSIGPIDIPNIADKIFPTLIPYIIYVSADIDIDSNILVSELVSDEGLWYWKSTI